MSLPVVLSYLEKPEGHLDFILAELYGRKLESSEQEHVCSRVLNLLRNYHLHNNFYGVKIINVLLLDSSILSQHGAEFFMRVIKTISNINNFHDDGKLVQLVLRASIRCIETLLQETRGKPALTRDIVTPNLPSFIGEVIKLIDIDPFACVSILNQLIVSNTTTFRPFGSKFEKKIFQLLHHSLDSQLTKLVNESYVYCKYILSQKNNQDLFATFFSELVLEIKSVLKIYHSFVDLENSNLVSLDLIPGRDGTNSIFEPLQIDTNAPLSIYHINERLEKLVDLLVASFQVKHNFKIPLGLIVLIDEVLLSFNPRFTILKREFRFIDLKHILNESIVKVQKLGVSLLSQLQVFEGELVPHFNSLLSSLEYSVPELVLENEVFVLELISNTTSLLKLTYNYTDYPMITKLIDASFKLTEPRASLSIDSASTTGSKKNKQKKNKTNLALSDLMSHADLFVKQLPAESKQVVNDFYEVLITNVVLPATKKTQIVRYALVELISNEGISKEISPLLKAILLNPTADSVNILPFVSKYASKDEFFSLFINPRLPPLAQKVKVVQEHEEEEEEEEEQEETETKEAEQPVKRRKLESEDVSMEREEVGNGIAIQENEIFTRTTTTTVTKTVVEDATVPVKTVTEAPMKVVSQPTANAVLETEQDDGSDVEIEIPDIEMSSDDED